MSPRPQRAFPLTGTYPVRELVHMRMPGDLEYVDSAVMFILMMRLAKDPAEARLFAGIARSDDSAS